MAKGENTDIYLLNLKNKMDAIKVKSVRPHKIYPALINNGVAVCAYSIDTTNMFAGYPTYLREFTMKFFVLENGAWKFASKESMLRMREDDVDAMLSKYKEILKDKETMEDIEFRKEELAP